MPCFDEHNTPRDWEQDSRLKAETESEIKKQYSNKINELTRLLCKVGKQARAIGTFHNLPIDIQYWIRKHEKADARVTRLQKRNEKRNEKEKQSKS
jgi:hypothetical protein